VLLAAARRFGFLLVLAAGVTIALALPAALLFDVGVGRAISVGFYLIGSFLLVSGFFVGNRGPARPKGEETTAGATAGMFGIGIGARGIRWATPDEREEAISSSALFVALGFVLILFGALTDSRVRIF
jgi:hypothetical protein